MAGNLIQIKRSQTAVINSTWTNSSSAGYFAQGELVYTGSDDTLWIGKPGGGENIRIAGRQTPGVLTNSQALVANATGFLNQIKTANLTVGVLVANSTTGSDGQILYTNSAGIFWADAPSTNTELDYDWTGRHTFANSTIFSFPANSTFANSVVFRINDTATQIVFGNTSVYTTINASAFSGKAADSSALDGKTQNNLNVNNAVTADSALVANSSTYTQYIANSTAQAAIEDLVTTAGIAALVATLSANAATYIGNSSVYFNANTLTDNILANSSSAYTNAMADTLTRDSVYTGNSSWAAGKKQTFNSTVEFGSTANVSFANTITVSSAKISGDLTSFSVVNSTSGAYETGPYNLGKSSARWGSLYLANNGGISFANSSSGDEAIIAKYNGANSSYYDYIAIPKLISNVFVSNTAQINHIQGFNGGQINVSSNVIFNATAVNASNTVTFYANNIQASTLSLAGNFVVAGTTTTACSEFLVVNNPYIELAYNNDVSDVLDSGFFMKYTKPDGEGGWTPYYAGLAREAGSDVTNPIFSLFGSSVRPAPNATFQGITIDNYGTLKAYLDTGAFKANSTSIGITANSSVRVDIVANTITLAEALGVAYGGTGKTSYTTGSLIYASGATTFGEITIGSAEGIANGQVLQIVNNLPAYGTLDGGEFS
jgi:hypothetical protein